MPIRLDDSKTAFEAAFRDLLSAKREVSEEVDRIVADIIAAVRERGDAAVIDYTRRFDALDVTAVTLRVSAEEIDAAVA
ncbi:MAG: histidinol dehydrogenase, partial [Beijerinckiaceae bacterium]|nr:histidinol dehydrogenase [Beijerinckiaceae bacterium]